MTTPCAADLALRRDVARETGTEIQPGAFDLLIDGVRGPTLARAQEQARAMCAQCPVWFACLRENRGEEWVALILGIDPRDDPTPDERCGSAKGYKAHRARKERPCDDCKAAARVQRHDHRQERKAS